jgi:AcrR family transcriptional regulator
MNSRKRQSKPKRGRPADPSLPARRRQEILDAASELFAKRGYANMDIESLARLAGVGKGTVYRYFTGKRQLFRATVTHEMDKLGVIADFVDACRRISKRWRRSRISRG